MTIEMSKSSSLSSPMGSIILYISVFFICNITAYRLPSFRRANDVQQMNNPNMFMDPSFTANGKTNGGGTQGMDIAQTASRGGQNKVVMAGPPLGSGTQGKLNQVQVSNEGRAQTQTGTDNNSNTPLAQGAPVNTNVQGPQTQYVINRPNAQVSGALTQTGMGDAQNAGIQQSVSGSYMFNPGKTGSVLQAPPGTGNSQFNNNIGSRNSMLNQFGGNGLSVDPSQFFRPKQNPDGSISGAAGNAVGPPTIGPMAAMTGGGMNNNNNDDDDDDKNDNKYNNSKNNNYNNNYNAMFGPPSFFMNPGSSFGQK